MAEKTIESTDDGIKWLVSLLKSTNAKQASVTVTDYDGTTVRIILEIEKKKK